MKQPGYAERYSLMKSYRDRIAIPHTKGLLSRLNPFRQQLIAEL